MTNKHLMVRIEDNAKGCWGVVPHVKPGRMETKGRQRHSSTVIQGTHTQKRAEGRALFCSQMKSKVK